jgi:hypothetical protein
MTVLGRDRDDLPRLRALFALARLSEQLRSDALADGLLATRFDLKLTKTVHVGDVTVSREDLFQGFRCAADGLPVSSLTDRLGADLPAEVSIDAGGAGLVEMLGKHWRFEYAVLLSGRPETRQSALARFLTSHTISRVDRDNLQRLTESAELSGDEFLEMAKILDSSLESFVRRFRERLANGAVAKTDLIPDNPRYWTHFVPPVERSATLDQFIADELAAEWRTRIEAGRPSAFASVALTCAAPSLVPRSLFADLPEEAAVAFAEAGCTFDDPFGLIATLQLCVDRVAGDSRFIALGDCLLDRLFEDMDRLAGMCQLFAATFIVTTAHLSQHESFRDTPAFWRRLIAASHASLVVRAAGAADGRQDELVPWAVRDSGEAYMISILSDFSEQPRWRPEWIDHEHLLADICGRGLTAIGGMPADSIPPSWRTRADSVKASIENSPLVIFSVLPAVLEGARRAEVTSPPVDGHIEDLIRQFEEEPSPDRLLVIAPLVHVFGLPPKLREGVMAVIDRLRYGPSVDDNRRVQRTMSVVSHVAADTRDVEMAEALARRCIGNAGISSDSQGAGEALFCLLECDAAQADRATGKRELAERLRRLAAVVPTAETASQLLDLLQLLKIIQPELATVLGGATALATLGRNSTANV